MGIRSVKGGVFNMLCHWRLLVCLPMVGVVGGCVSEDMQDLDEFIAQKNTIEGSHPEPIREPEPYVAFTYPGHNRDPFDMSAIKAMVAEPGEPEAPRCPDLIDWSRPLEYLESFPLDGLAMVGTLEQEGVRWALVKTPDKTIQRVTVDNYLGLNRGRIMNITQTSIELAEVVPDGFGCWKRRENQVALSD